MHTCLRVSPGFCKCNNQLLFSSVFGVHQRRTQDVWWMQGDIRFNLPLWHPRGHFRIIFTKMRAPVETKEYQAVIKSVFDTDGTKVVNLMVKDEGLKTLPSHFSSTLYKQLS